MYLYHIYIIYLAGHVVAKSSQHITHKLCKCVFFLHKQLNFDLTVLRLKLYSHTSTLVKHVALSMAKILLQMFLRQTQDVIQTGALPTRTPMI